MDHDERKTDDEHQAKDMEVTESEMNEFPAVEDGRRPEVEPTDESVPVLELDTEEETVELTDVELNELIESICTSKAEEFRMIGYEHVTGKEIWECVSDKYQKTGMPALHKIVNDILSLKVTQFMNWMTMSIYKSNPFS